MLIRAAGLSDRGPTREQNDDHYSLATFIEQDTLTALTLDSASREFEQFGLLAAVADGMGGYAGGATASRTVLETLAAQYYSERRAGMTAEALAEQLAHYLAQTARVLRATLERSPEIADAGTTLSGLALLAPDRMVVFHIGDSRVLRCSGGYLRALTVDHRPFGAEIAAGRMTEAEARARPDARGVTRSLWRDGEAQCDLDSSLTLAPGDLFLLGTDGWHSLDGGLPRDEVKALAAGTPDPAALACAGLARAREIDGRDNATLLVVQIAEETAHG